MNNSATYRIGPGQQFADLQAFAQHIADKNGISVRNSIGIHLQEGDVVEIFPNVIDAINTPYLVPNNGDGFALSGIGTEQAPIIVRGVPDTAGNRPILSDRRPDGQEVRNVMTLGASGENDSNARHLIVENLIVDGGMLDVLAFVNGKSGPSNRFGANAKPAFDVEITPQNMGVYLKRAGNAAVLASPAVSLYAANTLGAFIFGHRTAFATRAIYHRTGEVTIRNCVGMGAGTGLHGADYGPDSLTVEGCEFCCNGMCGAGHNIYINGDNCRYPNLVVHFRNNFVHHAVASMGFRSRVGRTILHNNFFLDNGARQVDLLSQAGLEIFQILSAENGYPEHWNTRWGFRVDHEVIGNVFVTTQEYPICHVRIGGGGMRYEESLGRYRFVNNTFVKLGTKAYDDGDPNKAITAQFGLESVEMYNNVFYAVNPRSFTPFADHLFDRRIIELLAQGGTNDDGTTYNADTWNGRWDFDNPNEWKFGVRQVAGANNWVSHNIFNTNMPRINDDGTQSANWHYGNVPPEWQNTLHGIPGEDPFADKENYDFRLRPDATAHAPIGCPVGTVSQFLTREQWQALHDAGTLPLWSDYHFRDGTIVGDNTQNFTDQRGHTFQQYMEYPETKCMTVAPWRDSCLPNPKGENLSTPPVNPTPGTPGQTWTSAPRNDDAKPLLGAYGAE